MSKKMRLLSFLMRSGEFEKSYAAEQLIRKGKVSADGKIITNPNLSIKVKSRVLIGDKEIKPKESVYIIFNKPQGYVCQKGRERSVYDLIHDIRELDTKTKRTLFTVGRLDKDTEGLLIVTNDGEMEKLISKPESHIEKTYLTELEKDVSENDIKILKEGVNIMDDDSGREFLVKALEVNVLEGKRIEITIDEGRKRQVKKMLESLGNKALLLRRVGIGRMRIQDMKFSGRDYIIVKRKELIGFVGICINKKAERI